MKALIVSCARETLASCLIVLERESCFFLLAAVPLSFVITGDVIFIYSSYQTNI